MDVKKTLPWAITDASVIVDRTGRAILHSSLRDERPGERVAIARLAAAAPDLLAACEAAANFYDHLAVGPLDAAAKYGPDYEPPSDADCLAVRQCLSDAIAKARGES